MPEVKNKTGEIFPLQDRHAGIILPLSLMLFNSKSISGENRKEYSTLCVMTFKQRLKNPTD